MDRLKHWGYMDIYIHQIHLSLFQVAVKFVNFNLVEQYCKVFATAKYRDY